MRGPAVTKTAVVVRERMPGASRERRAPLLKRPPQAGAEVLEGRRAATPQTTGDIAARSHAQQILSFTTQVLSKTPASAAGQSL